VHAKPHILYCVEVKDSKADDVFTADCERIPPVAEREFLVIILCIIKEHCCWLHVKCLSRHNIIVFLNKKVIKITGRI
jgi:hypothetical protein